MSMLEIPAVEAPPRRRRHLSVIALLTVAMSLAAVTDSCGGPRIQGNIYNYQLVCDGYGVNWSVGGLSGFPGDTRFYYQFNVQFRPADATGWGYVSRGEWRSPMFTTEWDGTHGGFAMGMMAGIECGSGTYLVDALAVTEDGNVNTEIETKTVVCGW